MTKKLMAALAITAMCTGGTSVLAVTDFVLDASSGDLHAKVTFHNNGSGKLIVTLQNLDTTSTGLATEVLTGIFFNMAGNPTLTPVSALLSGASSVVQNPGTPAPTPGGNVGGEWGYGGNITPQYGANHVISSSGYSLGNYPAASSPNFNGTDLNHNAGGALDGVDYGIIGTGTLLNHDGVSGQPLIRNSVIFTLSGLSASFDPKTGISDLTFQYGTAVDTGPHFPPHVVPEPTTFIAGALLLLPFGASALRIMRRKNQ